MADSYSLSLSHAPAATPAAFHSTWLRPVLALGGISTTVVAAYVANSPRLDSVGDTPAYEFVADRLPRSFISSGRMPGYPTLMALSSLVPGGRQVGLIAAQGILVVASVVATYFIARAVLGKGWMAFLAAAVLASDLLMAGYVRVEMSETLAVALTQALVLLILRYMLDYRPLYLWLASAVTVALTLTRPEWALVMAVLGPYVLMIAWRRGSLTRRVLMHGIAAIAAAFVAVGAYCTANYAVNDYFGLSSISNIALLGKVKVYNMTGEAPPPYSALTPQVDAYHDTWALVLVPPFNDRNTALAGEFARAAIFHNPLRFAQDVMGTAITSAGEHDSQFLFIHSSGPFGRQLHILLVFDQLRYRAFVIFPALALGWLIAGLLVPPGYRRVQMLGALGLLMLYSWLTTAAGTYGEFERLRMTVNPISTVVVLGTFLMLLMLGLRHREKLIPAMALIALDLAAIGFLPRITSTVWSELVLLGLAGIQVVAVLRWSSSMFGTGPNAASLDTVDSA